MQLEIECWIFLSTKEVTCVQLKFFIYCHCVSCVLYGNFTTCCIHGSKILFAHRSGFRVRFIYATSTTFIVALGIIIAASNLSPAYYQQYAGYMSVIFLMGMMISYEEESLRRTFFVLKSIRTLEFDETFSQKLQDVRSKGSKSFDKTLTAEPMIPLINTSAQMAYASRLGMYSQMFNIIIAVADVITSSL
ncbi:hypothetical protein Plhal304r1_c080g0166311 [Plasmopara halstedii]